MGPLHLTSAIFRSASFVFSGSQLWCHITQGCLNIVTSLHFYWPLNLFENLGVLPFIDMWDQECYYTKRLRKSTLNILLWVILPFYIMHLSADIFLSKSHLTSLCFSLSNPYRCMPLFRYLHVPLIQWFPNEVPRKTRCLVLVPGCLRLFQFPDLYTYQTS